MSTDTSIRELRRVVWVGGALDKYTGLVRQHVLPGQHYFQWFEQRALSRFLQQQAGQPVLVIAHSYGASMATRVIANGYRVDELVTIDPVSWRRPNGAYWYTNTAGTGAIIWPVTTSRISPIWSPAAAAGGRSGQSYTHISIWCWTQTMR